MASERCVPIIQTSTMSQGHNSLLNINQIVDNTTNYELLSFLNTYFGYNQIKIYLLNEHKTTFTTKCSNFCNKVMQFVLKMLV